MTDCAAVYDASDSSSGQGGGIYCKAKEFYIGYEKVSGTETYRESGKETRVTGCRAGQEGGGVFYYSESGDNSALLAAGCTVSGCAAGLAGTGKNSGGGIYAYGSTTEFKNCTVRDNRAPGNGGGICQNPDNTLMLTIDQCFVIGNTSGAEGGGIYAAGHTIVYKEYCYLRSKSKVTKP